jgi:Arc/MetJ family transcription regulator
VIFKAVRDGRPYPDHGFSARDWSTVPPRTVRLSELTTTRRELALDQLLDDDSTFYGDLFPHAVQWRGEIYLEDGLHRALRAALQSRNTLHVRVLDLDALRPEGKREASGPEGKREASSPEGKKTAHLPEGKPAKPRPKGKQSDE